MTIVFSKLQPKTHPNTAFLVPNLRFFKFLHENLKLTNSRVVILNMTIAFSILQLKTYQNKAFLIPNLKLFDLHKTLNFDKSKGVDFKYGNSFSKFQNKATKKNANKAF